MAILLFLLFRRRHKKHRAKNAASARAPSVHPRTIGRVFEPPPPPLLAAAELAVDCAAAVAELGPDVTAGLDVEEPCDVLVEEPVSIEELELVDDEGLDDVEVEVEEVEEAVEDVVLELELPLVEVVLDAAFDVEVGAIAEVKAV